MTAFLRFVLLLAVSLSAASRADENDTNTITSTTDTPTQPPYIRPTNIPEVPPKSCDGQVFLFIPDQQNDQQYIVCEQGHPDCTMPCPDALVFNYTEQRCDWY